MKAGLLYVSLLLPVLAMGSGCATRATALAPVVAVDTALCTYNMQFDFMRHHFSGLLAVRRQGNGEVRMVGTSYFGPSLFDFSLKGDSFVVNHCIDPLRKEKLLLLLKRDFGQLFLGHGKGRLRKSVPGREKRTEGRGIGKAVYDIAYSPEGKADSVRIRHPFLRLTIRLNILKEQS